VSSAFHRGPIPVVGFLRFLRNGRLKPGANDQNAVVSSAARGSPARRHGWALDGLDIFELVPAESMLDDERELTVLHPAEIAGGCALTAVPARDYGVFRGRAWLQRQRWSQKYHHLARP